MDKKIIYCKEPSLERVSRAMNTLHHGLKVEGIDISHTDSLCHSMETKHVVVRFVTESTNMDGIRCDEYFGFDPSDNMHYRLKDPCKTRYRGTVIGYIVKTEAEETLKDEQEAFKRQQRLLTNTMYGNALNHGFTAGLLRNDPYITDIVSRVKDEIHNRLVEGIATKPLTIPEMPIKWTYKNADSLKPIIPNIKSYIKKVVFNDPATIIFWTDDTKTVVKAENEPFDPEKGMAMAIAKKVLGNKHDYYNIFVKWMKKYKPEESSNEPRTDAKRKALEEAYQILLKADDTRYDGKEGKATKIDYYMTVETALGYLGEALEG